jgi:hypothetical protein
MDMKKQDAEKRLKRAAELVDSVAGYLGDAGLEKQAEDLDTATTHIEDVHEMLMSL